jgi:exopolyphosphatase/guanosine-5'-triphosphate,3'-diphosphate pyrophosphatase
MPVRTDQTHAPRPTRTRKGGGHARAPRADGRIGVIDIGSNSIRLVVFDGISRVPVTLFNEKALCGLGRGLGERGRLDPAAMRQVLATLRRFAAITREMEVRHLDVIATAAVRDAADGPAFVGRIARETGLAARIIDGAEEARLSALGVLSGIPDADGVMGDLGGGSLELVDIHGRKLGRHVTMPLGPLRLDDLPRRAQRAAIEAHLNSVDWLPRLAGRTLYAVGGTWRGVARAHMAATGYPLHVIHGYRVSRAAALGFLKRLSSGQARQISAVPGLSRRRADTLPLGALVLERLVRLGRPSAIVFSAHGLREGCVFEQLSPAARARDPLIEGATQIAREGGVHATMEPVLSRWMEPLFPNESPAERRLRIAACLLGDVARTEHPDHRAEHGSLKMLRLPLVGLDHSDRAFLALAIGTRYAGDPARVQRREITELLEAAQRRRAALVGHALRLAYTMTGGAERLLARTRLIVDRRRLILQLRRDAAALVADVVARRLAVLATAFGRVPDIENWH